MKKLVLLIFVINLIFVSANSIVGNVYSNDMILKNEVLQLNVNSSSLLNKNMLYKNLVKKEYLCPIKGVKINKNIDWLGFVEYKDGTIIAISSPKYTFSYYNTKLAKEKNEISNILVTDFYTKKIIDAKKAFYVFGSNVMSIGGDDIIPFEDEKSANDFLLKNSGKNIYKFNRMNERFIEYLNMK